jgi:hypothetical protein
VQLPFVALLQAQLADVFGALVVALFVVFPVFHGRLFGLVDAPDVTQQVGARFTQRVAAEEPRLDLHTRKAEALGREPRHFLVAELGAYG